MDKLRKTIYFSEETWKLIDEYIYRYGWKDSSISDLVDYCCRTYITAHK